MRKYIPHIIIGLLILACALQWLDRTGLAATVATEKQKNKNLTRDNEILDKQIVGLEETRTKLQDSIAGLNIQIADGKALIEKIQKDRDEKLKIVERLTVSDMQQYFDKRYGPTKK